MMEEAAAASAATSNTETLVPTCREFSVQFGQQRVEFVASKDTHLEALNNLIRTQFKLSGDTKYSLITNDYKVADLKVLLERGKGEQYRMIVFDGQEFTPGKSKQSFITCEPHHVVLQEQKPSSGILSKDLPPYELYNPVYPDLTYVPLKAKDEALIPTMPWAIMRINLPTRVQLRHITAYENPFHVIDVAVDAEFGLLSARDDSKTAWFWHNFRLRILRKTEATQSLQEYENSGPGQLPENFTCQYNPHAYGIAEHLHTSADHEDAKDEGKKGKDSIEGEEKDKEDKKKHNLKKQEWNQRKASRSFIIGPAGEWTVEMTSNITKHVEASKAKGVEAPKPATSLMKRTFVQSFMFEDVSSGPYHFEFDVMGEVVAQLSGENLSSDDEVYEVAQGAPKSFNPGRKRIAASQKNTIYVQVDPATMTLQCSKRRIANLESDRQDIAEGSLDRTSTDDLLEGEVEDRKWPGHRFKKHLVHPLKKIGKAGSASS